MLKYRPAIEQMEGYVPGEQPQLEKFIKLNTNENPYPCSPKVRAAIGRVCQQGLQRYPDPHATSFRLRAAELFGIEPDSILCGNGSDDILTIVTRAFVDPGQKARFASPSYVLYKTLVELQGGICDVVRYEPDWSLPQAFGQGDDDLRIAYLANPNSPSGTVVSNDQIAEIADSLPCPLLVDEAYVDFADNHAMDLVATNEKIMVSRSLSKSYGLAGIRFGFLVAQPQVIAQLRKVKDSYNCDSLAIAAATAAIDDQGWLAQNQQAMRATRDNLLTSMQELGFAALPSQANFVWCPHPDRPVQPLYEQLKQNGVLVRYMNYADWEDGLRVSVGTDEQNEAFLTILKGLL